MKSLNALLAIASTSSRSSGPVIVGHRLRKGPVNTARGAGEFMADAIAATRRTGRLHAVFTNSWEPTLIAEAAHPRDHAIVQQVIAALKSSALKHFPSGIFNATQRGRPAPSSPTTSPELPPPSPAPRWARPAPRRSAPH